MPRLDSKPRGRLPTLDDTEAVDNDKEWNRLLRNAKAEQARKDAELAEARARAAKLEARLSQAGLTSAAPPAPPVPPAASPPKVDVDTDDPKALRFRSRWGSLVVPIAWITAAAAGLGPPIAVAVQHFVRLQADIATLRQVVGNLQTEVAALRQERSKPAPATSPPRTP